MTRPDLILHPGTPFPYRSRVLPRTRPQAGVLGRGLRAAQRLRLPHSPQRLLLELDGAAPRTVRAGRRRPPIRPRREAQPIPLARRHAGDSRRRAGVADPRAPRHSRGQPGGPAHRARRPPRVPAGRLHTLLRPPGMARVRRRAPPPRRQPLQGPAQHADLGPLGRREPVVCLDRDGPRLPLLLRKHPRQVQVVVAGQVHPGRAQRPPVAPLQALGGRRAAPLQQRGGRDAAVQALPLREPRRAPPLDGRRDGSHRPRARGTLPRRLVPQAVGRDMRPAGR